MRLDAKQGRAVIRGDVRAIALPRASDQAPYVTGQRSPLQYPQSVTDSYGELVRTNQGTPRYSFQTQVALEITGVRKVNLRDVELLTARCLGHRTIDAFRQDWDQAHNFKVEDGRRKRRQRLRLLTPLWIVYFNVEHVERVHLLAKAGEPYTTSPVLALDKEPEALDPADIAHLPSSLEAKRRHAKIKADDQARHRALPVALQVAHAIETAKAAGVDTRAYEASILARVRSLENRAKLAA